MSIINVIVITIWNALKYQQNELPLILTIIILNNVLYIVLWK